MITMVSTLLFLCLLGVLSLLLAGLSNLVAAVGWLRGEPEAGEGPALQP
jgi:hypothetical protein